MLPIYPLDGYRIVEACSKTDNAFLNFVRTYSFWLILFVLISGVLDFVLGGLLNFVSNGLISVFTDLIFWVGNIF